MEVQRVRILAYAERKRRHSRGIILHCATCDKSIPAYAMAIGIHSYAYIRSLVDRLYRGLVCRSHEVDGHGGSCFSVCVCACARARM